MSIPNKLKTILSLQSIAVKVKSIYRNVQKVFDAGYATGYEEGIVDGFENGFEDGNGQWKEYCLKTGEHFDLPEGMTEIPQYMFENHTALESVSIPNTVTKINYSAFSGTTVRIRQFPEALETIEMDAFRDCKANDAIVFSPSITRIGYEAFSGNTNLTEVTFVKTSTKSGTPSDLDWDAFPYCPNLTIIRVPWYEGEVDGEPWCADKADIVYGFWDKARNSEVFTFPQGFVKIPDYLFYDTTATNAKEIYLGDECEEIGEAAFYRAKNLETVHLPDGLKKIGAYAFRYSSALNCSELPDSVEEIANRAFHGSSISLTKLPTNIKELGISCFQGCSGNMFTEIPAGIVRISAEAFLNNTGLTKLFFLSTPEVDKVVKGIASDAFAGCTNLVEIGVPWSEGQVSGAPWGAENATIIYDWRNNQ